jgi:hypothetical protein
VLGSAQNVLTIIETFVIHVHMEKQFLADFKGFILNTSSLYAQTQNVRFALAKCGVTFWIKNRKNDW